MSPKPDKKTEAPPPKFWTGLDDYQAARICEMRMPRFIYFVAMQHSLHVKIGSAQNVPARLRELQTGNPEPLIVLATIIEDAKYEFALHQALRPHRMHGEWFRNGPWVEQLVEIIRLNGTGDDLLARLEKLEAEPA